MELMINNQPHSLMKYVCSCCSQGPLHLRHVLALLNFGHNRQL